MALISGPDVAQAIADPDNDLAKLVASQPDDRKMVEEVFLRILNRPASDEEIQMALDSMKAIETDHQTLLAALGQREADWAENKPQLERQRGQAIAEAEAKPNWPPIRTKSLRGSRSRKSRGPSALSKRRVNCTRTGRRCPHTPRPGAKRNRPM